MESRQSRRIHVQCPCTFSGTQITGEGIVFSLSIPGCAVETNAPVAIGTNLELHLLLPVHFFPIAVDQAVVVWTAEGKFGVKFIHVRPEEGSRLSRIVSQYLRREDESTTARVLVAPPAYTTPAPLTLSWRGSPSPPFT